MKVTKKLIKTLCAGLAGCLILGCLAGCGDEKETVSGRGSAPSVPPELVYSGPDSEYKIGTRYVIPDGMMMIGDRAFWEYMSLTSIEIPDSVTEIGSAVFVGCSALKTVKVPKSMDVKYWGLGSEVQVIYY